MTEPGFEERVRQALAAFPVAAHFPAPYLTFIVADNDAPADRLEPALAATVDALAAAGIPETRIDIMLGSVAGDVTPANRTPAVEGLRVGRHIWVELHNAQSWGFTAGRLPDGTPVELNDELREAEAIVVVGPVASSPAGPVGGVAHLVPGVATAATRLAFERARAQGARAAWDFARAAEALAPVNLALCWDAAGHVTVGRGADLFAAHARAAGCA